MTMFRSPLHSVLLLVVACSQILGGVSCCCLGRSLVQSFRGASSHVVASAAVSSNTVATDHVRCPKCLNQARGKTNISKPEATTKDASGIRAGNEGQASDEAQCNCTKRIVNLGEQNDRVSVPVQLIGWASEALVASSPFVQNLSSLGRFEAPHRFGGRSWQSIACLWRN